MSKYVKLKNAVAFGSSRDRFSGGLGIHPGLDPNGAMVKRSYSLSPGQYNPCDIPCSYKARFNESWRKKLAIEQWSKNIGYTHPEVLAERQFLQSTRGPGAYDINENFFKIQSTNVEGDNSFGKQKRFRSLVKDQTPPPGTYTGDWINKPITTHKQMSNVPSFEWDGFVDRFRGTSQSWKQPPNIYNVKDGGGIDDLVAKRVSIRGPYDLFTGPRDGSTIKNHFSPGIDKGPEEYFKVYPSEFDKLLTSFDKRRYGKFYKARRWGAKPTYRNALNDMSLCYKNPSEPGPAHYSILKERTFTQSLYPFSQSVKEAKPSIKWKILPGVGRYNPRDPRCSKTSHKSWMFLSKIGRPEFKAPEYNAF
ncbi:lymphocyte expansion molecule-like [Agrilus planipennis]|uniref:Lymphocyte expansion molecule-like n=1 Tax=Agrilus planipennis TaxID=224129 RepID=A0A1W4WZ82_AGRPL|nr:lymphocyte expansion molecule-like [Agrilus planipennis]